MALLPDRGEHLMILVPGRSHCFGGEGAGKRREASPVIIIAGLFAVLALGSRLIAGGVHDEELPSCERMHVGIVARRRVEGGPR
jgi:hypothetical protein